MLYFVFYNEFWAKLDFIINLDAVLCPANHEKSYVFQLSWFLHLPYRKLGSQQLPFFYIRGRPHKLGKNKENPLDLPPVFLTDEKIF